MPLSKKVCVRCINLHRGLFLPFVEDEHLGEWLLGDEAFWIWDGEVLCPFSIHSSHEIRLDPPARCPYIVEHAVSQKKERWSVDKTAASVVGMFLVVAVVVVFLRTMIGQNGSKREGRSPDVHAREGAGRPESRRTNPPRLAPVGRRGVERRVRVIKVQLESGHHPRGFVTIIAIVETKRRRFVVLNTWRVDEGNDVPVDGDEWILCDGGYGGASYTGFCKRAE